MKRYVSALAALAVLAVLALGMSGCGGTKEAFQAWQTVETARVKAWSTVHTERARHNPVSTLTITPPPGEKEAVIRGTLKLQIAHPELAGANAYAMPPTSPRPKTDGELTAEAFKRAPSEFVRGLLGWKGMEEAGKTWRETSKNAGSHTTYSNSFNGNTQSPATTGPVGGNVEISTVTTNTDSHDDNSTTNPSP